MTTRKYVTESRRPGKPWVRGRIVWEFPTACGYTAKKFADRQRIVHLLSWCRTQVRLRRVPDATPVSRQEPI